MGKLTRTFFARVNFVSGATLLFIFYIFVYLILSQQNVRFDFTKEGLYTLSPQTVQVLESFENQSISVKAFFKDDQPGRQELEDLLRSYVYVNSNLKYQFLDPDRYPGQSQLYGVDEYGTVIVENKDKRERFVEISEEALTNALVKLTQLSRKQIYFLQGHGEKLPDEQEPKGYHHLKTKLENENYLVNTIYLTQETIPQAANLVIIAGPQRDFLREEIESLNQYISSGGKLLALIDPVQTPLQNIKGFFSRYGVVLNEDLIIDKLSKLFGADFLIPVITTYGNHPITEGFKLASFMPYSRSIGFVGTETNKNFKETVLAFTSQGSWAEKDMDQINSGEVTFNENDQQGPVPLGLALDDGEAMRMVVFGDSDFADNSHFYLSGNKDLILNTIAWLVGEEKLVTIRSKGREPTPLVLTDKQQKMIFVIPVLVLPATVFFIGMLILFYRRRYR